MTIWISREQKELCRWKQGTIIIISGLSFGEKIKNSRHKALRYNEYSLMT